MTHSFDAEPQRHAASPPPATATIADIDDEPWGYECALPFLQVTGGSPEPETQGWPRVAVR